MMKRWLLILLMPCLLAGCVLDGFELPASYAPLHPGAAEPVPDGAVFHLRIMEQGGGDVYLRFLKIGKVSYAMETYAVLSDGEEPPLPPLLAHFIPLDARHHALHWRMPDNSTQGYALVRLEPGRLVTLTPPRGVTALSAIASQHQLVAKKRLSGGYALDPGNETRAQALFDDTAEPRVLAFLKAVATRGDLDMTNWSSRPDAPSAQRDTMLARFGAHIARIEGNKLPIRMMEELAAYARVRGDHGDSWALYALARFAANGWGMETNLPLARVAAEGAIRGGVAQANQVLAALHFHGLGQPADAAAALPYARLAADAGVPAAMSLLGQAYRDGRGVAADRVAARRWFRAAADAGYATAHAFWADLMLDERTPEADAQAIGALEAGIKANDANAHYLRGFMHENGRGGTQDFAAATEMFLAASARGHDYAEFLAGERLRRGQGVPQDIIRGRELLARAAKAGIKDAEAALKRPDVVLSSGGCAAAACASSGAGTGENPHLNNAPYVFAGLRYGASYLEALRLFGEPEQTDDATASTKLFWANGKFEVSYQESTGFINSFTITGREGTAFVRSRVPAEGLLKLLDLSRAQAIGLLGKPTEMWYHDTRMDWSYGVDKRTRGSIFLECTRGAEQPCDEMTVHWSGTAIWDPNDGVDSLGVRVSPMCSIERVFLSSRKSAGFLHSGEKAQTPSWDLEVLAHTDNRSWVLAGKRRDTLPSDASPLFEDLCELARGDGDYRAAPWYRTYFKE